MNGWDRAKELTEQNAGGLFEKLQNDGDSFVAKFCEEPWALVSHWDGTGYVECTAEGCTHCAKGVKKSTRVKFNVWNVTERRMKIWECSGKAATEVRTVRDKYGLEKWCFEVKRHGAAKSTKTTYSVLPERELTADEKKTADAAQVHDLKNTRDEDDDDGPAPATTVDPDAKIHARVVAEFRERIKLLPLGKEEKKRAYYALLGVFGCERLDDLVVAQEARARSLIERAERGESIALPPGAEDGDFA